LSPNILYAFDSNAGRFTANCLSLLPQEDHRHTCEGDLDIHALAMSVMQRDVDDRVVGGIDDTT
jgi:hypothetical protein